MPYYVYILQSSKTGKFYIGSTNNLIRRLADHQRGKTPSTRGRGPWAQVYSEEFPTRAEAVRQEMFFKKKKNFKSIKRIIFET